MAESIDADLLISLVEERPVLWDKTNNYYKDKYLKTSAWKEICQIIFPSFEDQSNKAKTKLIRDVVKKWTNIKDNFIRYSKRLENLNKSEGGAKKVKEYHLYKQLLFLNKNAAANLTDSSITGEEQDSDLENERNETSRSRYQPTSLKRKLNDESELRHCDYWEPEGFQAIKETENRHLSFFKAILPSLDKLNDYQTLIFQSRVLQILTELHQPHPSTSTDVSQHPDVSFEEMSNDNDYKIINPLESR